MADLLLEALREVQFNYAKYAPESKGGEQKKHKFTISIPLLPLHSTATPTTNHQPGLRIYPLCQV